MPDAKAFVDTNVLLYLLSADNAKANKAEAILQTHNVISVQVLNELTNVARRKLDMPWPDVSELIESIASLCHIEPLTVDTHNMGRALAEKYGISVYDAMIVAAALLAGCAILYTEDLQNGLLIDRQLRVCNPF